MPASAAEQRVAFALIVFLFIVFVMVTPFASVPLPRRVGCYRCPDVDGDSGRKIPSPHVRGWDAAGPYHQLYDRFYMAVQRRRTFSVV
jgi:hypothetical protein